MTSPTSYFAAVWERWDRLANLRATADTTPRVEPVDPPAEDLAAMFAPPTLTQHVPATSFEGDAKRAAADEAEVLGSLADRIAEGMSPLAAAQEKFGAPHA